MGQLSDLLRAVAADYSVFCEAAADLQWAGAQERHGDIQTNALGVCLDLLEFPPGYVEKNLISAYVQTVLSGIAFSEGWDRGFWNISQEKRKEYLALGERMYRGYAMVREVRLIDRTWEYLSGELEFFAQGNWNSLNWNWDFDLLTDGSVVEIGGSYSGDYVYFAIKDNKTLLASCGYWD